MGKVHYFQRYKSYENTVTNNTLQLIARIYSYAPQKAAELINKLVDQDAPVEIGLEILQQSAGRHSRCPAVTPLWHLGRVPGDLALYLSIFSVQDSWSQVEGRAKSVNLPLVESVLTRDKDVELSNPHLGPLEGHGTAVHTHRRRRRRA